MSQQPHSSPGYTWHPFLFFTRSLSFHTSCPQASDKVSPTLLVRLLQAVTVHLLSKAEMGARLLTCKLTTTRPSGSSYLSTRHNRGSAGKKSLNEGRQVGLCKSGGRHGLPSTGATVLGSGAWLGKWSRELNKKVCTYSLLSALG